VSISGNSISGHQPPDTKDRSIHPVFVTQTHQIMGNRLLSLLILTAVVVVLCSCGEADFKRISGQSAATINGGEIGEKIQAYFGGDAGTARREIQGCQDSESLADSLVILCERLLKWMGGSRRRVIFLVDEAETLVLPYRAGGAKKIELEQFLQSLRERTAQALAGMRALFSADRTNEEETAASMRTMP